MKSRHGIRLTTYERRQLRKCLEQGSRGAAALRIAAILLSGAGMSSEQVARIMGISGREVRKCRQRWKTLGLSGLQDAPRKGRPSEAGAAYIRLLVRTAKKDPRKMGYAFSRWTAPRLSTYLAQETGIALSADYLGKLLRNHGLVWGRSKLTTANLVDPDEKKISREMAKIAAGGLKIASIHF